MKIAICDDKELFHKILKNYLDDYASLHSLEPEYYDYTCGQDLVESGIQHDLIFMDYQMEGLDGLETSELLRKKKISVPIIFLTSYPQVVFDAFRVNAYRFLVKPIEKDKLYSALNSFLQQQDSSNYILVKNDDTVMRVSIHDILYIEASGKNCIISISSEKIPYKGTLAEIEQELPEDMFFRSHRAYLVGLKHIVSHDNTEIQFDNGDKALISKTKLAAFRKALTDHMKRHSF